MAYYDALIAAWNNPTQPPPGVTGPPLTAGMTNDQKLTAINSWTVVGPARQMVVPTYQIYNLIEPTEWDTITAPNKEIIRDVLGMGSVDASAGTVIRARLAAMFPLATFPVTRPRLNTLAASFDSPQIKWTQANGYPPINGQMLVEAGLQAPVS